MRSHAIRIGIVAAVASVAMWGGSGVASAGGGCHSSGTAGRGDTVELSGLCFITTVLYVEAGTEVTWTNDDSVPHNVVGFGDSWGDSSLSLLPGDHVSYGFGQDGVYPYACWLHPGMIGAVVVGDGVGPEVAGVVVAGPENGSGVTSSADGASAPAAADGGFALVTWIAGAALLLAGLGGGYAIAARSRRREVVVG